jgi:DNA-binding SARP family transcriptional activator
MDPIEIRLFGTLRVERQRLDAAPEPLHLPHKVQALLAWLLVHPPHPHPRERIADDLWGDQGPERAQSSLSTALWRLRQILEPEGLCPRGSWIVTAGPGSGELGFNWESPYWLDILVFESAAERALTHSAAALTPADAAALDDALRLCTADLLEGFYDDWVLRRRESLRRAHLNTLAHLMRYYRHARSPRQSASYAHALLERDPLREEIHRMLMILYVEMGQTPDALRQYDLCAQALAREMGIPPMPETQELHRRIVMGEPLGDETHAAPPALPAPLLTSLSAELARELRAALDACDDARRRVQAVLDALERSFIERLR